MPLTSDPNKPSHTEANFETAFASARLRFANMLSGLDEFDKLVVANGAAAADTNFVDIVANLNSSTQKREFLRIRITSATSNDATRKSKVALALADAGAFADFITIDGHSVGIGATPSKGKLHVDRPRSDTPGDVAVGFGNTSYYGLRDDTSNRLWIDYYNGATWGAGPLSIDAPNGRVGVGIAPSHRLHIKSPGVSTESIRIDRSGASAQMFSVQESSGGDCIMYLRDGSGNLKFQFLGATGQIYERGRATPLGEWATPSFSAGDYTAGGSMTWTVASGDRSTQAYTLIGKTMKYQFYLTATTLGGTASNEMRIAIPGGFVAAKSMIGKCRLGYGGTSVGGLAVVVAGGTYVSIYRDDGANHTLGTDNVAVLGEIEFEFQ